MKTQDELKAAREANANIFAPAVMQNEKHRGRLTYALACAQAAAGLDADGRYDRGTEQAVDAAIAALAWPALPPPALVAASPAWPPFDGPLARRPGSSHAELNAAFGDPTGGDPHATDATTYWKGKNLVDRGPDKPLPGMHTTGPGRYVTLHRLVMPYADEGLRRGRIADPSFVIESLGGFNLRHQRNNPAFDLSIHSWGGALDLNSEDNFSVTYGVDEDGPEPWSPAWYRTWKNPGAVTRPFVEAMESVGWIWGGRWRARKGKRGFRDPMHFQLAGGLPVAL